ncbi:unnamed protein product [Candidula unifasciata]|uniref:FAD synthase n=1 Tax=Candidula unifasciata TaxID=100452 RepID=A0A8S3ZU84_9EUPU|nr:unnamed protein product [Candidula unifasciata]
MDTNQIPANDINSTSQLLNAINYVPKVSDQSTAGIIVIGDEILKGQTLDTNSNFICKKLFSLGVKVQKISVICDDVDIIAEEVTQFSQKFTHVITSGGIGPTHDDMTFEGVAKAFGLQTQHHPKLVELITDWFHISDLNSAEMKMAKIPEGAKLSFGIDPKTKQESKYPLVSVRNVHMFPGVPSLLEKAFIMLGHLFQNPNVQFYTDDLYVNKDEASIAASIAHVAEKYKDTVAIGSYPDLINSYYKVKLTLESMNVKSLQEARKELYESMPAGTVIDYEKDPVGSAVARVYTIVDDPVAGDPFTVCVRNAVATLERALEMYQLSEICVGFNGGKDCTVMLHLWYAVVKKKFPDYNEKLQALYIRSRYPFPEVEKFVQLSRDRYNLQMIHYDGRIKECLATLKVKHPQMKAVIMGTRKTDPCSDQLREFSMTDADWPQLMRVNPLLEWHYKHVWQFLRQLCLPYCSLYDRGYSSLGSMDNTHPNPLLQYIDERGVLAFRPAYLLENGERERDGRNK